MNPIRFSKILIVDDSESFRIKVKRLLIDAQVGYYHYEAKDGEEGISMYKKYKPHIVIMDIMMPNVGGIQAINEIMEFDPDAKIIVVSTRENKEIIDAAVKSGGAKDYIIKPFSSGAVVMTVSKQLSMNRDYKRSSTSFKQIKDLKRK
ncbi:response regulator transcription factor [Nitrosopumilus adriaticus]|uniref:Putative chemotaxis response regulator receiver protein CheY n=1 Tax=Nitrosopumilus adriaticus TaxID=1580092 RepID=A0A0D5C5D0_9ARCH|nr:response regulator [Nitrosopumilus adriaticus]AJW71565.1 putative chemotaxis response regulator receiver protein CheY [Nitrosopumilus adriaticus]